MWEVFLAWLAEGADQLALEFHEHGALEWFLFFAPLLLIELPICYLPPIGVVIARWLGYPRIDTVRREAFLASGPRVTAVIAGRNEAETVELAIESMLDQDFPPYEIIVIDDASEDEMYEVCARYARRGKIRLIRNAASVGRSGRPSASNLGMRLANGDYIVSVDADTTFDRRTVRNMIAPFADPGIGVVAGNIHVRDSEVNMLTRLQDLEYITSIDLSKRWTDLFGRTLQASGALGAFRRSALLDIGGWDPELAEDGDLSLRMVKAGWRTIFSPEAVAVTDVPTTWKALSGQRRRWDRGELRTYFQKHRQVMRPSVSSWSFAFGVWTEFLFFFVMTLTYPIYLVWLVTRGWHLFAFVMVVSFVAYALLSMIPALCIRIVSTRVRRQWPLIEAALVTPIYKGMLRWVRVKAIVLELLRIGYQDRYLPEKAWVHAPRTWPLPPGKVLEE